ncbi:hypothetical protein AHF37_03081 [Paragonimus kellicotti]|nr:hypothetical protein AHF37_03081 [Paragonimus kellicotti]
MLAELVSSSVSCLLLQTMRWIICEIQNLWLAGRRKIAAMDASESTTVDYVYHWQPWTHIYAVTKVGKEPNIPQYNPYGKYAVKLYWMGCWRKVIVDDQIPFDEDCLMLLPQSRQAHELWPMLLTKALLKIASLDYGGSLFCTEFGDFSAAHCLTGWLKHTIVVKSVTLNLTPFILKNVRFDLRNQSSEMIWDYLEHYLPVWKRPDQTASNIESHVDLSQMAEHAEKPVVNTTKEKKESGKGKRKTRKVNKATRLSDMGFSCLYSNPICLSAQRKIPLVAPLPEKPIQRWKLIRPQPPDFQFNEYAAAAAAAAAAGTQERKEAEPIRSLLLCTPLHKQSFREPVDLT